MKTNPLHRLAPEIRQDADVCWRIGTDWARQHPGDALAQLLALDALMQSECDGLAMLAGFARLAVCELIVRAELLDRAGEEG